MNPAALPGQNPVADAMKAIVAWADEDMQAVMEVATLDGDGPPDPELLRLNGIIGVLLGVLAHEWRRMGMDPAEQARRLRYEVLAGQN